MNQEELYNLDICLWAEHTAKLLRSHRWNELDLENLIEEVEDLSKRERDKLLSCFQNLIMHLLKWKYQPKLRCSSWKITIKTSRNKIVFLLQDTPSLKQYLVSEKELAKAYLRACKEAADETSLPLSTFPEVLPFQINQILDDDFWP